MVASLGGEGGKCFSGPQTREEDTEAHSNSSQHHEHHPAPLHFLFAAPEKQPGHRNAAESSHTHTGGHSRGQRGATALRLPARLAAAPYTPSLLQGSCRRRQDLPRLNPCCGGGVCFGRGCGGAFMRATQPVGWRDSHGLAAAMLRTACRRARKPPFAVAAALRACINGGSQGCGNAAAATGTAAAVEAAAARRAGVRQGPAVGLG